MANVFGKDCGPKIINDPPLPTPKDLNISLKRDNIIVGNSSAIAQEAQLDSKYFDVENIDCDRLVFTLKPLDHGDLIGLDHDDHLQYVHISEEREISADHLFTGGVVFSGSPKFSGDIRDSEGNVAVAGQVPTALADGKFKWKSQKIENVFWVSKDGNDANDGLSPQTAKASIKAAVRQAWSGDRGKILDAAESILANKSFIVEEVSSELYIQDFTLPNSSAFDLKSRTAYQTIMQSRDSVVNSAIAEISATDPVFSDNLGYCTRDSKLLVLAIAKDIFYGGYENTKKFIKGYFNSANVLIPTILNPAQEIVLTVSTFNSIRIRLKNLLPSVSYAFIRGKIDRLIGFVTGALSSNSLDNVPAPEIQEGVRNQIYYNIDALVESIWAETLLSYPTVGNTESTCKRDIKLVGIAAAEDIAAWGTSKITEATRSYFDNVGIFATPQEQQASAYAYTQLKNAIKTYTSNQSVLSHIDVVLNVIIDALEDNTLNAVVDSDEGVINKSARFCNRDLGLFIDALASDMKNGGNVFSVEFAEGYYDQNNLQFITNQLEETLWALDKARDLMILSMKNWRSNADGDLYVPQYALEKIFVDNSIVYEDWPACANAETAINNYYGIVEYILENGPNAIAKEARALIYDNIALGDGPNSLVNRVWAQTAIEHPQIEFTESKCKRDIILVLEALAEDLYSTGNSNMLKVVRSYFAIEGTNPIETQITESVYSYALLEELVNTELLADNKFSSLRTTVTTLVGYLTSALSAGNLDSLPTENTGTWTLQQPSYKTTIFVNPGVYWEENPIALPPNTVITGNSLRGVTVNAKNRTLDMFHVNNACGLSFMTFSNHLAPAYGVAFPKKNRQGIAGIISRSPYVQQCTSITTTGGGMLVDGSLVGGFKSMVLDSYTQYNQGGPGAKITNNGYAQLVSLFTISCSTGIECASGGQCDLTNSNSSLGDFGLVADGLGEVEIVAMVAENVSPGQTELKLKLPGPLKPYNGQAGFFGAPYYFVQDIKVLNGGRGYTSTPTITIESPTGPQAIPARARAVMNGDSIESISVLKGGTSYISEPSITITPPTEPDAEPPVVSIEMEPILYRIVSCSDPDEDGFVTATLVTPTLYTVAKGTSFILSRQSKVLASGHSFEYIGAGPNIQTSLPIKNGSFIQQQEVEERNGGSVIFTSTDQSGNFRIGDGVIIDQASGTIGGISFSRGLFAQITPLIIALQ